ncbi:hypothetical protein K501DRAFT_251727 [Backusella circina FSU 941]|nr:hypothetical protein K501DRAFT_251727 [Backusella circina FSU 941]
MRPLTLISLLGLVVLGFTSVYFIATTSDYTKAPSSSKSKTQSPLHDSQVIMQYMGNKTEKAELGRATWKFLHTMMARYPEKPTQYERESLRDFMHLFSKLYPCGECAGHFQKLLSQFPPQTVSRITASQWLCAMHNKVNERLEKPIFDCNDIEAKYPCGCDAAEEEKKEEVHSE